MNRQEIHVWIVSYFGSVTAWYSFGSWGTILSWKTLWVKNSTYMLITITIEKHNILYSLNEKGVFCKWCPMEALLDDLIQAKVHVLHWEWTSLSTIFNVDFINQFLQPKWCNLLRKRPIKSVSLIDSLTGIPGVPEKPGNPGGPCKNRNGQHLLITVDPLWARSCY